jgi:hypothetical protein
VTITTAAEASNELLGTATHAYYQYLQLPENGFFSDESLKGDCGSPEALFVVDWQGTQDTSLTSGRLQRCSPSWHLVESAKKWIHLIGTNSKQRSPPIRRPLRKCVVEGVTQLG